MTFIDLETRAFKQLLPGIRIQTFWGEQQLLSFVSFAAHSTVPAHVMHSARSFDAIARVLDVFSPVRADYQY